MPRDGSGVYSLPPGIYPEVSNTTIESADWNAFVADMLTDANAARPIIAGGTGATTAAQARDAAHLQVERAMQTVTNYDSQVWENGSFWSAPGATSAPSAGIGFYGTAIVMNNDPNYVLLNATDQVGKCYQRIKNAGVWGAWSETTASNYVLKAGDTMTGNLTIAPPTGWSQLALNKSAGNGSVVTGTQANLARWQMAFGDSTSESGGNAGSNFSINRFDDAGAFLSQPFSILRQNGNATFNHALTVAQQLVVYGQANLANNVNVLGPGGAGAGISHTLLEGGSANTGGAHISYRRNGAFIWMVGLRSGIFANNLNDYTIYNGTTGREALVISANDNITISQTVSIGGQLNVNGTCYLGAGGTGAAETLVINGGNNAGGGAVIQLQKNGALQWLMGTQSAIYADSNNSFMIYTPSAGNALIIDYGTCDVHVFRHLYALGGNTLTAKCITGNFGGDVTGDLLQAVRADAAAATSVGFYQSTVAQWSVGMPPGNADFYFVGGGLVGSGGTMNMRLTQNGDLFVRDNINAGGAHNVFGGPNGSWTAPTPDNTNVLLYDFGSGNWCGLGADAGTGHIYFRTGNSGSGPARLVIGSGGNMWPGDDGGQNCGGSGNRWSQIWATNGTIQTSDERKKEIDGDSDLGLAFIRALRPIAFREKGEKAKVKRHGLGASQVRKALGKHTFDGLLVHDEKNDVDGMNYAALVTPLINAVIELADMVEKKR